MPPKFIKAIPFLVLAYFFIHFGADYFYFLYPQRTVITILAYFLAMSLLFFAGLRLFNNKNAFILSFSSLLFFYLFFGSIIDTLRQYHLFNPASGLLLKMAALFVVVSFLLFFSPGNFKKVSV